MLTMNFRCKLNIKLQLFATIKYNLKIFIQNHFVSTYGCWGKITWNPSSWLGVPRIGLRRMMMIRMKVFLNWNWSFHKKYLMLLLYILHFLVYAWRSSQNHTRWNMALKLMVWLWVYSNLSLIFWLQVIEIHFVKMWFKRLRRLHFLGLFWL